MTNTQAYFGVKCLMYSFEYEFIHSVTRVFSSTALNMNSIILYSDFWTQGTLA